MSIIDLFSLGIMGYPKQPSPNSPYGRGSRSSLRDDDDDTPIPDYQPPKSKESYSPRKVVSKGASPSSVGVSTSNSLRFEPRTVTAIQNHMWDAFVEIRDHYPGYVSYHEPDSHYHYNDDTGKLELLPNCEGSVYQFLLHTGYTSAILRQQGISVVKKLKDGEPTLIYTYLQDGKTKQVSSLARAFELLVDNFERG